MSGSFTIRFLTFPVLIILFAASCMGSENEKTSSGIQKRYQSPKDVFDAYRKACEKRDYPTIFLLSSPKRQSDAVYEAFFACTEQTFQEMGPIIPKYVDMVGLSNDYNEQYRKARDRSRKAPSRSRATRTPLGRARPAMIGCGTTRWFPTSRIRQDSLRRLPSTRITRWPKPGAALDPISPLGELEDLSVQGDTATAHAKMTILPRVASGESPLQPGQSPPVYDKPVEFRRSQRWLVA